MTRLLASAAGLVLILLAAPLDAGLFGNHGWFCRSSEECRHCQSQACMPRYRCTLKAERVPVEKECYDHDTERICVPGIRFPWQRCGEPRCTRVIEVRRLKTRKYECGTKCEYKWDVVDLCAPAEGAQAAGAEKSQTNTGSPPEPPTAP